MYLISGNERLLELFAPLQPAYSSLGSCPVTFRCWQSTGTSTAGRGLLLNQSSAKPVTRFAESSYSDAADESWGTDRNPPNGMSGGCLQFALERNTIVGF